MSRKRTSTEQDNIDETLVKRSKGTELNLNEHKEDGNEMINDEANESKEDAEAVPDTSEVLARVELMTLKEVKEELKKRDLSIKGVEKVLRKRLTDRLVKEQDPSYQPRAKGRHCKWCGSLMVKKSVRYSEDRWGRFFGCSSYPRCQYTTNLNGYARPEREHLKGIPAY